MLNVFYKGCVLMYVDGCPVINIGYPGDSLTSWLPRCE